MLSRIRRLPSPALVISAIALIVAIGGGTAALALTDNQKDKKIAKKVSNKRITARAPGLSVKHAKTADNATHATTADSISGTALGLTTRVVTQSAPVTGTFSGTDVTAPCQAGEVATGGGGLINNDDNEVTYQASHPSPGTNGSTPTGWTVRFQVTGIPHNVTVYAVCASP